MWEHLFKSRKFFAALLRCCSITPSEFGESVTFLGLEIPVDKFVIFFNAYTQSTNSNTLVQHGAQPSYCKYARGEDIPFLISRPSDLRIQTTTSNEGVYTVVSSLLTLDSLCFLSRRSRASFCPTASSPDWIPEWYTRRRESTSSIDWVRTSASSLILAVASLI